MRVGRAAGRTRIASSTITILCSSDRHELPRAALAPCCLFHTTGAEARIIGLDIGPSTIAAVAHAEPIFEPVIQPWEELRQMERAMDRSKRANDPECFDEKGHWKKGAKMPPAVQTLSSARSQTARAGAMPRRRTQAESWRAYQPHPR
jgi:putative transposase